MRYFLITFFILLTFTFESFSQRWARDRHHLIIGLGSSGFMGDLGGADDIGSQGIRDFEFNAVRPTLMAGYRYMVFENLGITGNLSVGYVYGDDQFTQEPFRNNRNIHFRSPIIELSSTAQLYLVNFNRQTARFRGVRSGTNLRFMGVRGYIFLGVGGFYFNPQSYFEREKYMGSIPADQLPADGWYNLRPLKTEGQGYFPTRNEYQPFSLAIPYGFGALFQLNQNLSIGIQYGYRKTFTDYIDDVSTTYVDPNIYNVMFQDPAKIAISEFFANPTNYQLAKSVTAPGQQRGNPYNTDSYMFGFITLYYKIPGLFRPYGVIRF